MLMHAEGDPPSVRFPYIVLAWRYLVDLALRAAALPGAAEFFSTWLQAAAKHSPAPPEMPLLRNYQPKFYAPEDFAALESFTEILIPADETPGARKAHCAHYKDFVLQSPAEYAPPNRKAVA